MSISAGRLGALVAGILCLGLFGGGSDSAKAQLVAEVGYLGHVFDNWVHVDRPEADLVFDVPIGGAITHGAYGFLGYRLGGEFAGFAFIPEVFLSAGLTDYEPEVGDNPRGLSTEDVSMHSSFRADVIGYGGGLRVEYRLDSGPYLYAQAGYAKPGFNPNRDFIPLAETVGGEPKNWGLYYGFGMNFSGINVALMKFTHYGPLLGAGRREFSGFSLRVGYAFQIRPGAY